MRPSSIRSFAPHLVLAVIPALFVALPLRAQLSVSDTVRLRTRHTDQASGTVAPQYVHGVVIRADSATLVVRRLDGGDSVGVARREIVHAELLRGTRRRGWPAAGKGALIGAGIGAAIGVASGPTPSGTDVRFSAVGKGVLGGVMGAVGGLVVGGIFAFTRIDNWVSFQVIGPTSGR